MQISVVQITPESTIVLVKSSAPLVKLDDKYYKLVDQMESLVDSPPSLVDASKLTVKGPVKFSKGIVIKGDVTLSNGESNLKAKAAHAPECQIGPFTGAIPR